MLSAWTSFRARLLGHPLVQLELRRIQRKRWWPGRRFFMFYPALWGGVLGCIIAVVGCMVLEGLSLPVSSFGVTWAALVTGLPAVCILSLVTGVVSWLLTWLTPAFTALSIVQDRQAGTFDLLRTTLLSERDIILGKLGGSMARLWPAILTLALLSPFQLIISLWGGLWGANSSGFSSLTITSLLLGGTYGTYDSLAPIAEGAWIWIILTALTALLSPWADLLLHAAIGQLVSVAARSAGAALAATYALIIVLRIGLYLLAMTVSAIAMVLEMERWDLSTLQRPPAFLNVAVAMPAVVGLLTVGVEFVGAVLVLWGAVEWLKRA